MYPNSSTKLPTFRLKYSNLPTRYELPVWYAFFSRKTLCSKYNFFNFRNKSISSNTEALYFRICCIVLNLYKFKLNEPENKLQTYKLHILHITVYLFKENNEQ